MKGGEEQSIIVPARCNAPSLLMWGGLPSVKRRVIRVIRDCICIVTRQDTG
jgi:hypothetical protein